jgi:hypothetical protein
MPVAATAAAAVAEVLMKSRRVEAPADEGEDCLSMLKPLVIDG